MLQWPTSKTMINHYHLIHIPPPKPLHVSFHTSFLCMSSRRRSLESSNHGRDSVESCRLPDWLEAKIPWWVCLNKMEMFFMVSVEKASENHTNLPSHLFTLYSHIKHPDLKWYEMVYCNDANGSTSNSFISFLNYPGSIHGSSYTQAQWWDTLHQYNFYHFPMIMVSEGDEKHQWFLFTQRYSKYPRTQVPISKCKNIFHHLPAVCQGSKYYHPKQYISHYSVEIPQILPYFCICLIPPSHGFDFFHAWNPNLRIFSPPRSLVLPCLCPHDPKHPEQNCRRSRRVYNWPLASPAEFLGVVSGFNGAADVGGWTNPFWKIWVKLRSSPRDKGEIFKKLKPPPTSRLAFLLSLSK